MSSQPINGLPATRRVTKEVAMSKMPDPLDHVTFRGKTMDRKTAAALAVLEQRLGYELTVVQGCYNAGGVSASAGTHDRGGVVDLAPYDGVRKMRKARELGFDAWVRLPSEGPWSEHVHMVLHGHQDLSPAAYAQTVDYDRGLNGLASHSPDRYPYRPKREDFSFAAWWRDDLLRQRITGLTARIKALREKRSAARAKITYGSK